MGATPGRVRCAFDGTKPLNSARSTPLCNEGPAAIDEAPELPAGPGPVYFTENSSWVSFPICFEPPK